jgi:hypothetical protein
MEFHLLPIHRGNPPIPVPKTPYVASERYDGGPWLSYPARKGKLENMLKDGSLDVIEYARSERVNPTPLNEIESFFQTWLYFGLIAEFTGANCDDDAGIDRSENDALNQLYKIVLVEDGSFVRLDRQCLDEFLVAGRGKISKDVEVRKAHYNHLAECLSYAYSCATQFPPEFNHAVRCSIAALGELFMTTINFAFEMLGLPLFGRDWKTGFLNEDMKASMVAHGWCPSDVARAEAKYMHIQTLFIACMLDRSLPPRNHSRCTASACNLYQINNGTYKEQHEDVGCNCDQLVVPESAITPLPLFKEGKFPLLLLKGDLHNLTYEIIESGDDAPFIAISHVWADGLGNPHANSLHKCKLQRLRTLVDAVNAQDPENTLSKSKYGGSLIWLDTLLSPAHDGKGKQTAIEKIRLVYQQAKHVLVLDAGLMAYPSSPQSAPEMLSRIFTSSWMRRLWTLQEGALAKSLYFQFKDEAKSLNALFFEVLKNRGDMAYRAVMRDVHAEMLGLMGFFNKIDAPGGLLALLDRALQFRSVSVPSDEPLCIGTLLSLDLKAILAVEKTQQARMKKVWELVAEKNEGLPAQILFFEEERLDEKGWSWAPKSLLNNQHTVVTLSTRLTRWADTQRGIPTLRGLRVQYPGYRITCRQEYGDGKPNHPWPGMPRIPEDWLQFRDKKTGSWYRIVGKQHAAISKMLVDSEKRRQYNELELFPLHDIAQTGRSVVVLRQGTELREALFATIEEENTVAEEKNEGSSEMGIAVKTRHHIFIQELRGDSYIFDLTEKLALQLRADPLTDAHLALHSRLAANEPDPSSLETMKKLGKDNEEFKASIKGLRDKMKEMTAEVIKSDEKFRQAVRTHFGESFLESIWVLIQDFFNHDIIAERLPEEQVWFVD